MSKDQSGESTKDKLESAPEPKTSQPQLTPTSRVIYDVPALEDFIDRVFADVVPKGAHRLVYSTSGGRIGFPLPGVSSFKQLARTTKAKSLYFCVASCKANPVGGLSHKKELFAGLHVVVLDDIGTKIAKAKIPAALAVPSYIIESSAGNFQYGYILTQPITNRLHAERLLSTVAIAGLTDSGGVSACKLVRLPAGVNGKNDPLKRDFPVTLIDANDKTFTPTELLAAIGYEDETGLVTWDRIEKDDIDPLAVKNRTQYLSRMPLAQSTDGMIDDVLEWLYSNDMVLNDSGDGWVDILCPWAAQHTDHNDIAGYMPFGRGDTPESRAFHCFHDHCKDRTTREFLTYIIENSEFSLLATRMTAWIPHGMYAFDNTADLIYQLHDEPITYNFASFKRSYLGGVVWAVDYKGKTVKTDPVTLWMESPFRITVQGLQSNPADGLIITDNNGNRWLNTCQRPLWGSGAFNKADADVFFEFIDYLLPDNAERDYFLDWLAMKMQKPTFRGTGIVMATATFGTGRSTLAGLIMTLLGVHNCANVTFEKLCSSPYNHWEDKLMVIVDEAREASNQSSKLGMYAAYEVLKQRVDTTNRIVSMEDKHIRSHSVLTCSSYLISTNHPSNAVALPSEDRRFTVMSNPDVTQSARYFTDLNAWIDRNEWPKHVFRWLVQRNITHALFQPLDTAAKSEMTETTRSTPARIAYLVADYTKDKKIHFITSNDLRYIITECTARSGDTNNYTDKYFLNLMAEVTKSFKQYKTRRPKGPPMRVRAMNWAVQTAVIVDYGVNSWKEPGTALSGLLKNNITTAVIGLNPNDVINWILAELT